jgi:hypothetical protein
MRPSTWFRTPKVFRRLPLRAALRDNKAAALRDNKAAALRDNKVATTSLLEPIAAFPDHLASSPDRPWAMQPVVIAHAQSTRGNNCWSRPCVISSAAHRNEHAGIIQSALIGCLAGTSTEDMRVGIFCGDGVFETDGVLLMRLWLSRPFASSPQLLMFCEAGEAWVDFEEGSSFTDFSSYWKAIRNYDSLHVAIEFPRRLKSEHTTSELLRATSVVQRINYLKDGLISLELLGKAESIV